MSSDWTKQDSDNLYGVSKWGEGYFGINDRGELTVFPEKYSDKIQISIEGVVQEMKQQKISFPAVIRFHDILRSRVNDLNESFRYAMKSSDYRGNFMGVYPVKVNQMREVVEEIVEAGGKYDFGLEAGSKAELMSVLAMDVSPNALTVLNGYKDEQYIRLALLGKKMGRNIVIVVEKPSELPLIIKLAREENVRPMIGIRSKLGLKSVGKWEDSSGERAKFGLCAAEILQALETLRKESFLDCLKLFHFHIGSQIPEIGAIKDAITEGARLYVELTKLGAPLEYFDVGGGLGVDYDGSRSNNDSSINYSMTEYAQEVVKSVKQICDLAEITHPHLVSESGRAITAHHSCVITKVIGKIDPSKNGISYESQEGEHILVTNMRTNFEDLSGSNYFQIYNNAQKIKEDTLNAFKLGVLGLEERAKVEGMYWSSLKKILSYARDEDPGSEFVLNLSKLLSSQYLCNFSVFQSAADSWAIKQVLPVVPIQRLLEHPLEECSIVDITCDSDGKISNFYDESGQSQTIKLHQLNSNEEYFIGIFLTGAYQDVMGDMHNLFGRLNEVHVYSDDDDPTDFYIEEVIQGQKASHVLKTMQYNPELMALTVKKLIDAKVSSGDLTPREGVRLIDYYEDSLYRYTYLS